MTTALKALAVLAALLVLAPAAAAAAPLFNTVEFRAPSFGALPQWERVLAGIAEERVTYRTCRLDPEACPSRSIRAWQAMVRRQIGRAPREQVEAVNTYLNRWRYKTDAYNYGVRDYWATPLEFLARSGDCEDYAIAKYVSLRLLGFAREQLRLVVVQDLQRQLAHAVLAVYLDGEVLILDNLNPAVVRQDEVVHYVPYYSLNETAHWTHVAPATADTTVAARVPAEQTVAPSTQGEEEEPPAAPRS